MSRQKEIAEAFGKFLKFRQKVTRENFIEFFPVTRHEIDKYFESFSNLKKEWESWLEDKTHVITIAGDYVTLNELPKTFPDEYNIEARDVRTPEDLAAFAGLSLEDWECTRFTSSVWDGKSSAKGDYRSKKKEKTAEELLQSFIEKAEKYAPSKFEYRRPVQSGKLFVLNLADTHLGKYIEANEGHSGSYNLDKAVSFYKNAVDELIQNAPTNEIETVMLVCGSDLFHFEGESISTSKLTRLESDVSWYKMYNAGCEMIADVVEKLAGQFKVEVTVVCGNHARLTEYALGSYIKAFFRNHPNVNVDNRAIDRKYFSFHDNLIGFTHGDEIKIADLPLVMMRENRDIVSKHKQFTFLTGHTHTDKIIDIKGVRVMVCPALCPPDKFHSRHNYVGNIQSAQGLLFAKWGLQQIIYTQSPEKQE